MSGVLVREGHRAVWVERLVAVSLRERELKRVSVWGVTVSHDPEGASRRTAPQKKALKDKDKEEEAGGETKGSLLGHRITLLVGGKEGPCT
jgi:hypothetical protein